MTLPSHEKPEAPIDSISAAICHDSSSTASRRLKGRESELAGRLTSGMSASASHGQSSVEQTRTAHMNAGRRGTAQKARAERQMDVQSVPIGGRATNSARPLTFLRGKLDRPAGDARSTRGRLFLSLSRASPGPHDAVRAPASPCQRGLRHILRVVLPEKVQVPQ